MSTKLPDPTVTGKITFEAICSTDTPDHQAGDVAITNQWNDTTRERKHLNAYVSRWSRNERYWVRLTFPGGQVREYGRPESTLPAPLPAWPEPVHPLYVVSDGWGSLYKVDYDLQPLSTEEHAKRFCAQLNSAYKPECQRARVFQLAEVD